MLRVRDLRYLFLRYDEERIFFLVMAGAGSIFMDILQHFHEFAILLDIFLAASLRRRWIAPRMSADGRPWMECFSSEER